MHTLRSSVLVLSVLLTVSVIIVTSDVAWRRSLRDEEPWRRPALTEWEFPSFAPSHGSAPRMPSSVILPVPFTSQAPHGNWDMPYQEACEEASVLMAVRYAEGKSIRSRADANAAILAMVNRNRRVLGDAVDESVEEVRELIGEIDPDIPVRLLHNPDIDLLRRELSERNAVIVPVAGQLLRNRHFDYPWPRYHMLVLRGYTADGDFIANEPGTKEGDGYLYPFDAIMDAMHDLVPNGDIEEGEKVVVVVEPVSR